MKVYEAKSYLEELEHVYCNLIKIYDFCNDLKNKPLTEGLEEKFGLSMSLTAFTINTMQCVKRDMDRIKAIIDEAEIGDLY